MPRSLPLLMLVPALLLGQTQNPTPDSEKATLEGMVINTATGEPVRKARLSLKMAPPPGSPGQRGQQPPPPTPSYSTSTDVAGKVVFTKLEPGSYFLAARMAGFADAQF